MHDIEPHFKWRDKYVASEDAQSPFFGRVYDEFMFRNKIYNYFIHPQWDHFGSETMYMKILFVDYDEHLAIIELIGEWNDAISNDIMWIKREVADRLAVSGITKYILIAENVLNFHGDDDAYYEEWYEDVSDENGWVAILNLQAHVMQEMYDNHLHFYLHFGERFNEVNWRIQKPENLGKLVEGLIFGAVERMLR